MLQYAFHKISIAFFSMILFTLNWNYMRVHFGEYMWLLLAGYLITLIITVVLILFSCSRQFHRMPALGGGFLQWKDERTV